MKLARPLMLSSLLLAAGAAQADGSIDAMLGGRDLKNEAFLAPVDTPATLGIVADLALGPTLPAYFSASGSWSFDSHDDNKATESSLDIAELGLGIKLMPREGHVRPFLGGGALRSWVQQRRNADMQSDSAISSGWYVDTGATLRLGRHFNVGANFRWVSGTRLELYGVKGDVDSRIFSVVGGFNWGEGLPQHHRGRE